MVRGRIRARVRSLGHAGRDAAPPHRRPARRQPGGPAQAGALEQAGRDQTGRRDRRQPQAVHAQQVGGRRRREGQGVGQPAPRAEGRLSASGVVAQLGVRNRPRSAAPVRLRPAPPAGDRRPLGGRRTLERPCAPGRLRSAAPCARRSAPPPPSRGPRRRRPACRGQRRGSRLGTGLAADVALLGAAMRSRFFCTARWWPIAQPAAAPRIGWWPAKWPPTPPITAPPRQPASAEPATSEAQRAAGRGGLGEADAWRGSPMKLRSACSTSAPRVPPPVDARRARRHHLGVFRPGSAPCPSPAPVRRPPRLGAGHAPGARRAGALASRRGVRGALSHPGLRVRLGGGRRRPLRRRGAGIRLLALWQPNQRHVRGAPGAAGGGAGLPQHRLGHERGGAGGGRACCARATTSWPAAPCSGRAAGSSRSGCRASAWRPPWSTGRTSTPGAPPCAPPPACCSWKPPPTRCWRSSTSRAWAAIAREAGARLVVDNVFASPIYQRPLELGADVVVYSATKHIDGQGRVLGGAVLGATTSWWRPIAT